MKLLVLVALLLVGSVLVDSVAVAKGRSWKVGQRVGMAESGNGFCGVVEKAGSDSIRVEITKVVGTSNLFTSKRCFYAEEGDCFDSRTKICERRGDGDKGPGDSVWVKRGCGYIRSGCPL